MNGYDPTSPHEPLPARPVSSASALPVAPSSGGAGAAPPPPPATSPDSVTMAKQTRRPRVRRLVSNRGSRWIVGAALMCAVIGLSAGCGTSSSVTATSPSASASATAGHPGPGGGAAGGGGSNARSGPAAGGAAGTVDSVSTPSFTMTTATGQKVTVAEGTSTTFLKGTSSTSASAITTGATVLALGTINSTTITATQVIVQPANSGSKTASQVVAFKRGAPSTSKQIGQVPANYKQGSGTIVSGTTAN
ncbi:MAG: hypothetical protein JWR58_6658, partial [Pseudonocardia sp.]|nr:hypothetical protein [Pseudonocardia sp.]